MHYKVKLTSILAPNIYDCSTRGGRGGPFLLTPRGRVWGASPCHGMDLFEMLVQNTMFSCIKNVESLLILPER